MLSGTAQAKSGQKKILDGGQKSKLHSILKHFKKDLPLTAIFLPCIVFYILFRYGPMYGLLIAFKRYTPYRGIMGSEWVGLKYFIQFFSSPDFILLFKNTLLLGLFTLLCSFPFPILFALLLNEVRNQRFKKTVQTLSYLPSFFSIVVICSMVIDFLSPGHGMVNNVLAALGLPRIYFLAKPEWFRTIYIVSDIWQATGFGAIIYLAAISGIDPQLYEASRMDGCSRLRSIWHITVPGIFPTIATMFILRSGGIMRIGFEKVLLLYNPTTYEVADVFSTFVYRKGMLEMSYSYAAAVGLFESVVALFFVVLSNMISKRVSEHSLW